MNLLQPVNPTDGVSWQAYVEYFQWSPVYNDDGPSFTVKPGDTLHGSIDLMPGGASYRVRQESVATGQASEFTIPVQAGRNYTIVYFVQEKVRSLLNCLLLLLFFLKKKYVNKHLNF